MTINHFSNILVVDDSSTVRGVVRKLLSQLGYRSIDEAPDGAAALSKITASHFDLVISDWIMEPMSGHDLLERVRANEKLANLSFIMMTADATIDRIVKARNAGVNCFINKPFSAQGLQEKILRINSELSLGRTRLTA